VITVAAQRPGVEWRLVNAAAPQGRIAYVQELHAQVARGDLGAHVRFVGHVEANDLASSRNLGHASRRPAGSATQIKNVV
jgi:hypothetical protein